MRYEYQKLLRRIFSEEDKAKIISKLHDEIEEMKREIESVSTAADERIEYVQHSLKDKKYSILGRTFKNGKKKEILLIIRLEDGTQFDERYVFDKIVDMRNKLSELKEKHSDVSWDNFEEEIK